VFGLRRGGGGGGEEDSHCGMNNRRKEGEASSTCIDRLSECSFFFSFLPSPVDDLRRLCVCPRNNQRVGVSAMFSVLRMSESVIEVEHS